MKMANFCGIICLLAVVTIGYVSTEERIETITFNTSWCSGNGDCGMDALGSVAVKVINLD